MNNLWAVTTDIGTVCYDIPGGFMVYATKKAAQEMLKTLPTRYKYKIVKYIPEEGK